MGPEAELRADLGRLQSLAIEDVLIGLLAGRGPTFRRSVDGYVRAWLTTAEVTKGLRRLEDDAMAMSDGKQWRLTKAGRSLRIAAAAIESRSSWGRTRETILPMAGLGLSLKPTAIQRFGSGGHLRAAALTVLFGLPLAADGVRMSEVRECLLARGLASRFPGIAMPAVTGRHKFDAFSKAILRGFAGLRSGNTVNALNRLVSEAVGAPDVSLDALRSALVGAALDLGRASASNGGSESSAVTAHSDAASLDSELQREVAAFAERVQKLADAQCTPPFEDRLAIATVYDVYGRVHPDAGSLSTFKQRILAAHRSRRLMLRRLDYIDAIDDELRERSEVEIDGRQFHFVARDA